MIDLCEIDIYASFVCWIGWLPTDIGENSQPEVYAACLLRKSQNTNKVAICQIQSRFICKHVMQRQEINISLPLSCKVGENLLCSRTYSGITRNRPARLGLLYLFIVGGQCHTRPLMHVPGVLGCCTPVHLGFGLSASTQVPDKPALVRVACPGILHRSRFV